MLRSVIRTCVRLLCFMGMLPQPMQMNSICRTLQRMPSNTHTGHQSWHLIQLLELLIPFGLQPLTNMTTVMTMGDELLIA